MGISNFPENQTGGNILYMVPDCKSYFKSKKITVMGLGLLGRGIGVVKFLAEQGADLLVTDLKKKEELAPALEKLRQGLGADKFSKIKFVLGEHRLEDFSATGGRDILLRAPNAPLDSVYVAEARKNNLPVKMDASLFAELAPEGVAIIGVTGTRGKSTVAQLMYEVLKKAGKTAYLAGNIRDTATLPLLNEVKQGDYVVLELDSWQLQGFDEAKISPHIAIFTSFFSDHLNYYKGDMQRYWHDKCSIFRHQKTGDKLIVSNQVEGEMVRRGLERKPDAVANIADIFDWPIKIRGDHGRSNLALVLEAAKILNIKQEIVKKIATDFGGLPGRQEIVGEFGGVLYVNDTNGTSPEAVIAALRSFPEYKGKIILLCGGSDKLLDYSEMGKIIAEYAKAVVVFNGTASLKIIDEIKKCKPEIRMITEVMGMSEAVSRARLLANPGEVIMLSPGAASFGMFKNEYDRGNQFMAEVKNMA